MIDRATLSQKEQRIYKETSFTVIRFIDTTLPEMRANGRTVVSRSLLEQMFRDEVGGNFLPKRRLRRDITRYLTLLKIPLLSDTADNGNNHVWILQDNRRSVEVPA